MYTTLSTSHRTLAKPSSIYFIRLKNNRLHYVLIIMHENYRRFNTSMVCSISLSLLIINKNAYHLQKSAGQKQMARPLMQSNPRVYLITGHAQCPRPSLAEWTHRMITMTIQWMMPLIPLVLGSYRSLFYSHLFLLWWVIYKCIKDYEPQEKLKG